MEGKASFVSRRMSKSRSCHLSAVYNILDCVHRLGTCAGNVGVVRKILMLED